MNKARRITRGRGRRPFRRYPGRFRTSVYRGASSGHSGTDQGESEYKLAEDTIGANHLRHRSVRSQAIEDYSVYSIHLSPESITSSKIATQSVDLAHLNFTPVQGITDRPLMQQFGILPFVFPEGESMIDITVPLQTPYMDHSYVMVVSCSDPIFHAGVRSCNELQGIVGITRPEGSNCAAGYLSWIAIGGQ